MDVVRRGRISVSLESELQPAKKLQLIFEAHIYLDRFLSPLICTIGERTQKSKNENVNLLTQMSVKVVTTISSYLSKHLKALQQKWLQSTAERSEYTLYALQNMLGIKMSGMSGSISEAVLEYRRAEVEESK